MAKAKDAFRTISEVAEWLDTPTHVLRFWETKFSQIRPVKGAGGRRYYRPSDMDLLGGIKQLLHEDGLTIKGAQKLLRDKGVKYVATLGASVTAPEDQATPVPQMPVQETPQIQPEQTPPQDSPQATAPEPEQEQAPPSPVLAPTPPPPPAQNILPFDDPAPARPVHKPFAPSPDLPDLPGRLIGRAPLHAKALRPHLSAITPLIARLETLQDRLHSA